MAKVKVLADRISISSDILTDEKLEKVKALAPVTLKLTEENGAVLYEVTKDNYNTFSIYGASFNGGKSLGTIPESIMSIEDAEVRKAKISNLVTPILLSINAIEAAVEEVELPELDEDIDFLD